MVRLAVQPFRQDLQDCAGFRSGTVKPTTKSAKFTKGFRRGRLRPARSLLFRVETKSPGLAPGMVRLAVQPFRQDLQDCAGFRSGTIQATTKSAKFTKGFRRGRLRPARLQRPVRSGRQKIFVSVIIISETERRWRLSPSHEAATCSGV